MTVHWDALSGEPKTKYRNHRRGRELYKAHEARLLPDNQLFISRILFCQFPRQEGLDLGLAFGLAPSKGVEFGRKICAEF